MKCILDAFPYLVTLSIPSYFFHHLNNIYNIQYMYYGD